MRFGAVPVGEAAGGILVHAVRTPRLTLRKGDRLGDEEVAALRREGVAQVTLARMEADDVGENEAAALLAARVGGAGLRVEPAFTGRANLFACDAGVLVIDTAAVEALNAVDEAVTLATLPPHRAVVAGEMVATVKIIPFAVARATLQAALAVLAGPPLRLAPYRPLRLGVISTRLPGLKSSVIAKTLRVMADRIAPAGASVAGHEIVDHTADALMPALARMGSDVDLIVVFGASAITDRRDVIPAAIVRAGGQIEHFGMPVDPGNLLLLAKLDGRVVIGAPGCARSPKENGFDWVLQRLLAGLEVSAADIRRMGAGGLLMEIVSRPQPRQAGRESVDVDG